MMGTMEVLSSRILIRPSDAERSHRFYRDVLGLAVHREFGPPGHRGLVFFAGQGLLEVSGSSGGAQPGPVQIWLQVRDVHAEHDRLLVRGSHGELRDDGIVRLAGPRTVVRTPLVRDNGQLTLGGEVLYRNPYPHLRLNDDEIATATLLQATAAWVRGAGPPPYPLAEGVHDHLIGLAIEEAADTGRTVATA